MEVEEGVTCRNTDIDRALGETKTGEEGCVEVNVRLGGEVRLFSTWGKGRFVKHLYLFYSVDRRMME